MLKPKNDVSISSVLEGRTGLALQSALHTGQCDKDPLPLDKGLPVVGRRIEVAELSSASAFVSEAGSGSHCPAFGRAIKRPKIKRFDVLIKTPKRFTSNTEAFWFERRSPCLFFVIHREGSVNNHVDAFTALFRSFTSFRMTITFNHQKFPLV